MSRDGEQVDPWVLKVDNRERRRIALIGAESTGKSTLALMLTGRLRTHGVRAALVAESGSSVPFPPSMLDSELDAHAYMITNKMAAESAAALRSNVDFVISDRSPFDHAAYLATRFDVGEADTALIQAAEAWLDKYEVVYVLRTEGSTYVEDGYRQKAEENDYRERVDQYIDDVLKRRLHRYCKVVEVRGSFRMRSEYVYHHVLHHFFGKSRPLRAYEQVGEWLRSRGHDVVEVRPQGSKSLTRFHPASDHDDIDAIVSVRGDAVAVREDWFAHKEMVESMVQSNLDLLITPVGVEAYEA